MKKLAEAFGEFIFMWVLAVLFGIYNAWLFMDLWNWFVVPATNEHEIGVPVAYGLLMIASWPLSMIAAQVQLLSETEGANLKMFSMWVVISIAHTLTWASGLVVVKFFM